MIGIGVLARIIARNPQNSIGNYAGPCIILVKLKAFEPEPGEARMRLTPCTETPKPKPLNTRNILNHP